MTPDQAALLRKARSSLHAAQLLAGEKLFDFAVSRAYYTMFYVAEALLLGQNLSFSKHSGVLAASLPSSGLVAGDVGTVVLVHREGDAFDVEFMTLGGETIAVATVLASQVRPVGKREVPQARERAAH